MARKTAKSNRKAREPESEVQEVELEAGGPAEAGGSISKTEAVRRALAAGKESPDEGLAFIMEQFGIEMAKPHFSAVKSQQRKKQGEGGSGVRGRAGRRPRGSSGRSVEGYLAPPPEAAGDGDVLRALEAMKPLVASLGAERVKRIVDLLG
jgi:hypothetical protein